MDKDITGIQSIARTAETISASFTKLKFVTIACLATTFAVSAFAVMFSIFYMKNITDKVYVVDKGQVSLASRQDASVTRKDEIIGLAGNFHSLFFNVSPVDEVVKANLNQALAYSYDQSVYNYYNDLQERGFYQRITQANAFQEVVVDSVLVNMNTYPYAVQVHSSLFMFRQSVLYRNALVTRMSVMEVPRDRENLYGLKLGQFTVVRNEEVARKKRNN